MAGTVMKDEGTVVVLLVLLLLGLSACQKLELPIIQVVPLRLFPDKDCARGA